MDSPARPESPGPERALRVVLVGDDSAEVTLIGESLTAVAGHDLTILHAVSLEHALAACDGPALDAIILDLNLSEADSVDAVRSLRRARPHTPIVVLAAAASDDVRQAAIANGAREVLSKGDEQGILLARRILYTIKCWRAYEERAAILALLMLIPDAILLVDASGNTHFINSAAENLFGESLPTFIGNLNSMPTEPQVPIEIEVARGEETRYAELRAVDFAWRDTPLRLAVIRDITESRREFQELRDREAQKLKALARTASGVAHDVMNLLTVVMGGIDTLQSGDTQETQRHEIVADMQLAMKRATEFTKQLLAIGKEPLATRDMCNLGALVIASERMLRRVVGDTVHLVTEVETEECIIEADSTQLNQVLLNLVVNARDALGANGQITLSVRQCVISDDIEIAAGQLPAGEYAVLSVCDNGEGMDELTRSHIFEPLFTTKRVQKGSGLGLAAVYGIVRENGGFIDVMSEVGIGTTFSVYFPAVCGPR